MFNFVDTSKYLKYFDTDRIVKIGDKVLDNPLPCHLFVDDKKTIFSQSSNEPPTYVYGELYTTTNLPVISQNVKVEKLDPTTGKRLAVYEGTPSKPIIGQSRTKYDIKFEDVAPIEYPRTVNVRVWDIQEEVWYDVTGLQMELTNTTDITPQKGFTWGMNSLGEDAWMVVMNNKPLFTNSGGNKGIVENIDEGVSYLIEMKPYPAGDKELIYSVTETPKPTPQPATEEFNVSYWDGSAWVDTQGGILKITDRSLKTLNITGTMSAEVDQYGENVIILNSLSVTMTEPFYFKENGGNSAVLQIESFGYPDNGVNARYKIIKESEVITQ